MQSISKNTLDKKILIPAVMGNILEWYDFSLYGFFAPIIAKLFFPTFNTFLALLATFGVFAAGFLMRPIGGIIFGYYGDKYGRKKTMIFAVMLMAIPTMLIGLLPPYAAVGGISGILLLTFRLLQGLAVGGELSGSYIYIVEHAPSHRRGFYGACTMFGAFGGLLLGSVVSALVSNIFSPEFLLHYGWRLPFLLGENPLFS